MSQLDRQTARRHEAAPARRPTARPSAWARLLRAGQPRATRAQALVAVL